MSKRYLDEDIPMEDQLPAKDRKLAERQARAAGTTVDAYIRRLLEGEKFKGE